MSMQANLQASATIDATYTAGDMTAGNVAPDFQRTINVNDSQGGSQPITFSFIRTAANTWSYEASYSGNAANLTAPNPISQGTIAFNSDGTLANVNGASPASGNFSMTIPWDTTVSGLSPQTLSVNHGHGRQHRRPDAIRHAFGPHQLGGGRFGVRFDHRRHGVKDGTVTAQFSNGLSHDVYKIPLATFTNPDGLTQISGNAYLASKASGTPNINIANSGGAGSIAVQFAGRLDRRSGDRVHQPDHHPAGLFRVGAHHHHRRPDAAAAGTVAD